MKHLHESLWTLILTILLGMLTGCAKDKKQEVFNESYDELCTYYINIDSLSASLGVSSATLVKIRYGLLESNPDLAEVMSDLCEEYQKYNFKKVNKILKKDYDFSLSDSNPNAPAMSVLKQEYKETVLSRNQKFDEMLPNLAGDEIEHNLEHYLDKKFAWYRFPINGWDWLMKGEKGLKEIYKDDITSILSTNRIDSVVVRKFNNYSNLCAVEQETLFRNKLDLPLLKTIKLEDEASISSEELVGKFIDRSAIDLTDTLLTVIEEILVAFAIWIIFNIISNLVAKHFAKQYIDYDPRWGWWNIGIGVLNIFTSSREFEAAERVRKTKGWIKTIVTIGFLVGSYYWVIKPAGITENQIITVTQEKISEYVKSIDLPILSYFNNVLDALK